MKLLSVPLAVVALATSMLVSTPQETAHAEVTGPPNIVLFQFDDLAVHDYDRNRLLRRVTGDKGLFFTQASVNDALCCPSRVSTLTGKFVHNHEVFRHLGDGSGFEAFKARGHDQRTVAKYLDDAGYHTAHVGKYMNRYRADDPAEPGWDYWATVGAPGREFQLRLPDGQIVSHRDDPTRWEEILGDLSVQAIEDWDTASPLYLQHDLHAPHTPNVYPRRFDRRFRRQPLPDVGAFDEEDLSDKPAYLQELPRVDSFRRVRWTIHHRQRMRATNYAVEQIMRIERAIEARGEADDTVFVMMSDNGYHIGSHRLGKGKQTPYRTDHQVPFAVWGAIGGEPIRQEQLPHLVQNIDLAPTFLALAGIPEDAIAALEFDGKSFADVITGTSTQKPSEFRRFALWQGYEGEGVLGAVVPPTYSAVVTYAGDKFVRYATDELEFYSWRRDPHESFNRASRLREPIRERLDAIRGALAACAGPSCRIAESEAP